MHTWPIRGPPLLQNAAFSVKDWLTGQEQPKDMLTSVSPSVFRHRLPEASPLADFIHGGRNSEADAISVCEYLHEFHKFCPPLSEMMSPGTYTTCVPVCFNNVLIYVIRVLKQTEARCTNATSARLRDGALPVPRAVYCEHQFYRHTHTQSRY
jgi:hypothetical protein